MNFEYGFIGTGNMGGALARAVSNACDKGQILLANRNIQKAKEIADEIGAKTSDNTAIANLCKYIFLGVKPQMIKDVLEEIKPTLLARKGQGVIVSMAAGVSTESICDMLGFNAPVIRIMPNTPVSVGKGIVLCCKNKWVSDEDFDRVCNALKFSGYVDKLDEKLIDGATAVAGCGPAFAYMFIEALADGGVSCGLPREKAIEYAAKMLEGSAYLASESNCHTAYLKDCVCSPGGSTIQGVIALEEGSFRASVIDAVVSAYKKTCDLGK